MFLRDAAGGNYVDISEVSGLDSPADGRSFATLDFDRDGWLDLVVVNANNPRTLLYRNALGDDGGNEVSLSGATGGALDTNRSEPPGHGFVALRLVGGNHTAAPAPGLSSRDGYGTRVMVRVGSRRLLRQLLCGEGFAAQNSATLLVGIGATGTADEVEVRWPGGTLSVARDVLAGTLLTVYEDPSGSPTGEAFVRAPYGAESPMPTVALVPGPSAPLLLASEPEVASDPASLKLLVSMATWCVACREETPLLLRLREAFAPDELAMFGVPIDVREGPDVLADFMRDVQPGYRLLAELEADQRRAFQDRLTAELSSEATPSSVVCDASGRVMWSGFGVPSVSQLRELLASR